MRTILLLAISSLTLLAADATGKWAGNLISADGDTGPALLVLKQDGDKLTGTAGPDESKRHEILNGKVDGDTITFELPGENGGMKFVLKQTGDSIEGNVSREREGQKQTAKLVVKREK